MSPRNNNIKIIFKRKYMMQVTLVETFVTSLSSTRGIFKAELTKEDSIVPRPKDLQSIRSTSRGKRKLAGVIESIGTNSVSHELKNS